MNFIHEPRRAGKTTKLIKLADNYNGYIVCIDRREQERVFSVSQKMKERGEIQGINFPITFSDFLNKNYAGRGCKKLFIDNADMLLQSMALCEVDTITVSSQPNDSNS